jgi:hypothetical protein
MHEKAAEQHEDQADRHLQREPKVAPDCVHDTIMNAPGGIFTLRFGRIVAAAAGQSGRSAE